jgi:uncharacterized membrane protein
MDDTLNHPDATLFDARLTPHRSLTPAGFRALMAGTFAATAFISLPFYLLGAWPIVGFFGLDVLGLYIALRMNFRAARAYEHFLLTYFELRFARVSAAGARREWRFAPTWVRLERVDDEDYGPQRLSLHCRGQRWDIARFLGPDQKADFATRFTRALALARRGPRYSE